jgi:dolichol kinase
VASLLPLQLSDHQIVGLGVSFAIVLAVSKRRRLLRGVHEVARRTWGEVVFPLGIAGLAALGPTTVTYVYGVLVMGVCDVCAGIVGQWIGRHPFHIGAARKTWEGSTAFVVSAFVIGVAALATVGIEPVGAALMGVVGAALVSASVEAVMPWGLDNLVLPTAAAVALVSLSPLAW